MTIFIFLSALLAFVVGATYLRLLPGVSQRERDSQAADAFILGAILMFVAYHLKEVAHGS